NQGALGAAGADHAVRCGQCVYEAAAHGLDVEGSTTRRAEIGLDQTRSAGKYEVGRGRGHDDEVDISRLDARVLDGCACGLRGKHAGRDVSCSEMPLENPCAFDNPLMGRFNTTLGQLHSQCVVGHDAWRQKTARTGYHRSCHDSRVSWARWVN